MDSTLKTVLKVAAAVVVPGAAVFFLAKFLLSNTEKQAFKDYVRKTYGEGSRYVDNYF